MKVFPFAMHWFCALIFVACSSGNPPENLGTDSDLGNTPSDTDTDTDVDTDADIDADSNADMETGTESTDYCANATPIHCGDSLSGTTVDGLPNLCKAYNCSEMGFGGPESIYLFVPDHKGEVEIRLTSLSVDVKLSLFAAPECDSSSAFVNATHCAINYTATQNEVLTTVTVEAGVSQYLIVDGSDEDDAGPYTLALSCAN